MHTLVTLSLRGDGKLRLEELVAQAIEKAARHPDVAEAFSAHPILSSITPTELLGKVSRKRASRVVESGLLGVDELAADAIFGRGRTIEETIPLALLLHELDLFPPAPMSSLPRPEVLFENDDFIGVLKPHDLPSAPLRSDETDSVVHRVLNLFPTLPILRSNPLEPGLVHRLDTGTSGVLLFAKTKEAFENVQKIWNTGNVRKIYLALIPNVENGPRPGRIDLLLGHDLKSKRKMRVVRGAVDKKLIRGDAQKAASEILRIRPVSPHAFEVEIQIETGVHHQIRATLAHQNAPILGDPVYGGETEDRLWLHAWKLQIPMDSGNTAGKFIIEIVAPRPENWPAG